ncbi:DUF3017 domain-containing protein [Actinotalea sp. K2]|uniref:DUF3017 domain-containing protein n=1 Tax=Actinotalea sp. K2 TaxID=2939438 RepID=UPI002016CCB7|nr:DUF3017 domain-containing protein [Actinotalea sp. K2]MCL3859901.1 DUF3017 domain-containing protein [Actinotalea sp. K2]
MTPALPDPAERHTAPALWLVVLALAGGAVTSVTVGARAGSLVVVGTLVLAAVARLLGRGRRPEGIAVRSTTFDVVLLLGLAVGVGLLLTTTGV